MVEWNIYANLASGALYMGLGLFALTVRPRKGAVTAFGVYGVAFGAAYVWFNAYEVATGSRPFLSQALLLIVAYGALFALITKLAGQDRRTWHAGAVALAIGLTAELLGYFFVAPDANLVDLMLSIFYGIFDAVLFMGAWTLLTRRGQGEASDLRVILVAVFVFEAVNQGMVLVDLLRQAAVVGGEAAVGFWWRASLCAVWSVLFVLAALREREAASRRAAWRLALIWLGLLLAGTLLMLGYTQPPGTHPLRGVLRTAGFLLLSYAILRRSLLGIDMKVRWGISRGTLAAAFVAVFFVVSEGAQVVLGEDRPWLGVIGAGMLVFAIAPLQRAAERLAERAVPVGTSAHAHAAMPGPAARIEAAYLTAIRAAARGGVITRREEHHLADLAGHLGLSPKRALELREAIERERVGEVS